MINYGILMEYVGDVEPTWQSQCHKTFNIGGCILSISGNIRDTLFLFIFGFATSVQNCAIGVSQGGCI